MKDDFALRSLKRSVLVVSVVADTEGATDKQQIFGVIMWSVINQFDISSLSFSSILNSAKPPSTSY